MTTPTLDWTCSRCGNRETWELVNVTEGDPAPEASPTGASAPTLDWTCSHCGTTSTYQPVPSARHA
jgi:predicted nucleic-acid-binding Zn-ribbon protein